MTPSNGPLDFPAIPDRNHKLVARKRPRESSYTAASRAMFPTGDMETCRVRVDAPQHHRIQNVLGLAYHARAPGPGLPETKVEDTSP